MAVGNDVAIWDDDNAGVAGTGGEIVVRGEM